MVIAFRWCETVRWARHSCAQRSLPQSHLRFCRWAWPKVSVRRRFPLSPKSSGSSWTREENVICRVGYSTKQNRSGAVTSVPTTNPGGRLRSDTILTSFCAPHCFRGECRENDSACSRRFSCSRGTGPVGSTRGAEQVIPRGDMSSYPEGVEVVEVDQNHVLATYRNVVVCVWLGETRPRDVNAASTALADVARRHPRGVGLVQIIESGARSLNADAREALATLLNRGKDYIRASAVVCDGEGFVLLRCG